MILIKNRFIKQKSLYYFIYLLSFTPSFFIHNLSTGKQKNDKKY